MNELYLITRLDTLCIFLGVLLGICVCMFIGYMVAYFVFDRYDYSTDDDYQESHKNFRNKAILFISLFIGLFICRIFTPTTKEALVIYGVGGTIDYVKSNEIVKELPDKCIQAADKFLNEYIEE